MGLRSLKEQIGIWVHAVKLQRERLFTPEHRPFEDRQADARLLVLATRDVLRGVDKIAKQTLDASLLDANKRFSNDNTVSCLKTLRDVFEHFDEYSFGTSPLQKKRWQKEPCDIENHISGTPSESFTLGTDRYCYHLTIGGLIVDVGEASDWALYMAELAAKATVPARAS
jgi:hypothetical protein